jgi:hypothetical protein
MMMAATGDVAAYLLSNCRIYLFPSLFIFELLLLTHQRVHSDAIRKKPTLDKI